MCGLEIAGALGFASPKILSSFEAGAGAKKGASCGAAALTYVKLLGPGNSLRTTDWTVSKISGNRFLTVSFEHFVG